MNTNMTAAKIFGEWKTFATENWEKSFDKRYEKLALWNKFDINQYPGHSFVFSAFHSAVAERKRRRIFGPILNPINFTISNDIGAIELSY